MIIQNRIVIFLYSFIFEELNKKEDDEEENFPRQKISVIDEGALKQVNLLFDSLCYIFSLLHMHTLECFFY